MKNKSISYSRIAMFNPLSWWKSVGKLIVIREFYSVLLIDQSSSSLFPEGVDCTVKGCMAYGLRASLNSQTKTAVLFD